MRIALQVECARMRAAMHPCVSCARASEASRGHGLGLGCAWYSRRAMVDASSTMCYDFVSYGPTCYRRNSYGIYIYGLLLAMADAVMAYAVMADMIRHIH